MKLEILAEAESELIEIIGYYEEIEPRLGIRLKHEVRNTIEWIRANAEIPRLRNGGYRRTNLKVFPYYIAYYVESDRICILAIAHSRRSPEYWLQRKKIR